MPATVRIAAPKVTSRARHRICKTRHSDVGWKALVELANTNASWHRRFVLVTALRPVYLMRSWAAMFVIELNYKTALSAIDAHMTAHVAFLKKYYAAGNFLVSGRKIPRDGGIILAVAKSRHEIETIIQEDPFYERGLADFRIIEFRASQRADDIQQRMSRA